MSPCMQKYRRLIGYHWPEHSAEWYMQRSNNGARKGPWPEVRWMKAGVLTATIKSTAPHEVEAAYRDWLAWTDFIQEVRGLRNLAYLYVTVSWTE